MGKCYQIKDQLLIVIIYSTYRYIYPENLNYEKMDFKFKTLLISLYCSSLSKKKVRGKAVKNALKFSVEIYPISSPLTCSSA